jgi:hypothetical protein
VRDFVFPMLRANTFYEGGYLLGTSIARPLIAKRQIEIARQNRRMPFHLAPSAKATIRCALNSRISRCNPTFKLSRRGKRGYAVPFRPDRIRGTT